MPRQAPRLSLGQVQQVVTLLATLANFNWKGLKAMFGWVKSIQSRVAALANQLDLKDYWGRLILIGLAAILIGFVLFDWRSQAVQKVEARAALAVAEAERDTLALKIAGDAAAYNERQRILMLLAESNRADMEELNAAIEDNPDWANQPLPPELRRRLSND